MDDPDIAPGGEAAGLIAGMRSVAAPRTEYPRIEFREMMPTMDYVDVTPFGASWTVRLVIDNTIYFWHGRGVGVQCFGKTPEYFNLERTQAQNPDWLLEIKDDGLLYGSPISEVSTEEAARVKQRALEFAEKAAREQAERVRKQQEAEQRAKDLFLRMLKPEQRKQYDKGKYVDVTAKSGKVYRIRCDHGCSGNVFWISPELGKQGDFCFYPNFRNINTRVPPYDYFLGQMMLIATDETKFLTTAVFSGTHHPDPKLYQRVREGWR